MWLTIPYWQLAGGFALLASVTFPIGAICGVLSCRRHQKLNDELLSILLAIGAGSLIFAVAAEVYAENLNAIEYVDPAYPICTAAYVVHTLSAVAGALLYIWFERSIGDRDTTTRLTSGSSAHLSTSSTSVDEASLTVSAPAPADRSGERGANASSCERGARETDEGTDSGTHARAEAPRSEGRSSTNVDQETNRLVREVTGEPGEERREDEVEFEEEGSRTPEECPPKLPRSTEPESELNEERLERVAAPAPSSTATSTSETAVWRFVEEMQLFVQVLTLMLKSRDFRIQLPRSLTHTSGDRPVGTEGDVGERQGLRRGSQHHSNGARDTDQVEDHQRSTGNVNLTLVWETNQLVDAVSEAMMNVFRTAGDTLSWASIIALCISSFPGSVCEGYLMRKEGTGTCRTLLFWYSVSCFTSVVSLCTVRLTPSHKSSMLKLLDAGVQGVTAGAILALATASMLPAAYEACGVSSGLYCVVGFLLSLSMRLVLELLNGPASRGEVGGTVIHAVHNTTSVEHVTRDAVA